MCKIQVKFAETVFYTEEVPVEVTNSYKESHLKLMDPIKKLIYRNNTLTLCNQVCPNASELGNESCVSCAKRLKLIRTPKKHIQPAKNMQL